MKKGVSMSCFYEKGLQFECTGCNYCCSCEPGYVFLSKEDLDRLCTCVGLPRERFIDLYCRVVSYGTFSMISLKEKDNFDCIFLTKKGCSVYEGRPRQCRTYPFWRSVVENKDSWEKEGQSCPGIGKGKKFSKAEIDEFLAVSSDEVPITIV